MSKRQREQVIELLPPHQCALPNCQWIGFRAKPGYYVASWLASHPSARLTEGRKP